VLDGQLNYFLPFNGCDLGRNKKRVIDVRNLLSLVGGDLMLAVQITEALEVDQDVALERYALNELGISSQLQLPKDAIPLARRISLLFELCTVRLEHF
jgi:hypothetical protein